VSIYLFFGLNIDRLRYSDLLLIPAMPYRAVANGNERGQPKLAENDEMPESVATSRELGLVHVTLVLT